MTTTNKIISLPFEQKQKSSFLPEFEATWFPIYWEPMLTSGERLTSAIVILGSNGQVYANSTLRRDVLKTIYGDRAESINDMLSWVVESARSHIETEKSLQKWSSPFDGMYLGPARKALGDDFNDIFLQAIQMTASLSSVLVEELLGETPSITKERDRWKERIKECVLISSPNYKDRFDLKFTGKNGARQTTIDYVGREFSANFAKLIPTSLSRSIKDAKSQILDLAAMRDQIFIGKSDPDQQQLMVWRPRVDDDFSLTEKSMSMINEAFLEIEFEGDKLDLRVENYSSPIDAANKIISLESQKA